jgi:predicted secreted hydrolase
VRSERALARALLTAIAALLLGAAPAFKIATAPYTFRFPRDHFAHDAYRSEWWYFTGHLRTVDGRRFGYELTFFRIGIQPEAPHWKAGQSRWYTYQLYPAHFAITDVRGHRFVSFEKLARDALGQGFASQRRLAVHVDGWSLTGTSAVMPAMHLQASADGDALDLRLRPRKPPAINGTGGISRKGACASCASHYYSFTDIATTGTIVWGGVRHAVRGTSWMDHEYGSSELTSEEMGWDWFAIQLRDGRDVMLYRIRERGGASAPQSSGSLVSRSGSVRHLPLSAFSIAAIGSWTSPVTHARYPSGWRVRVDGVAAPLEIVPVMRDQELAGSDAPSYWEGDCDVRDARTGARIGDAYVELTGYAAPLRY